jgi:hypothetical protein
MWAAYLNQPACDSSCQKYTTEHYTIDPLQHYGRIVPVQSGHQNAVLKRPDQILYEEEVDLTSSLLHGPINYEKYRSSLSQPAWNAMFLKATLRGFDTNNANSVEPL